MTSRTNNTLSQCSLILHLNSLEERFSDGFKLPDSLVPQGALQQLNLGIKELNGILEIKVGVDGDAHHSGHGTNNSSLILSRNRPRIKESTEINGKCQSRRIE